MTRPGSTCFYPKDYTLAHAWVFNRKPNKMANNGLKYQRIDPMARAREARVVEPAGGLADRCRIRSSGHSPSRRPFDPTDAASAHAASCSRHETAAMISYLVRRILYAIPILIGVNLLTFLLFFIVNSPDDMARMQLGAETRQ